MNAYGGVVGKSYSHLEDYGQDERRIRYIYEHSTAMHEMLTEFLESDPPVAPEFKAFLRDWAAVTAENKKIHESMIAENRFVYNDREQKRVEQLARAEAAASLELMDHLEGY